VVDATNAFELMVEDERTLAGLPASARQMARASAESKGKPGFRFTLQAPSVIAVLTYLDDAGIRRAIWQAYNRRAADAPHDNGPLIAEIVALRAEKARLLGKADFSDLVLEDRMAKTGAKAEAFIHDLTERTRAAFARETEELTAYRRELEGADAPPLMPWDVGYYAEKLRAARFEFDEEELRAYFADQKVLEGLFAIASRLYGVRFEERKETAWDPSVRTFAMRDGDRALGHFYVDLYPRENKRAGAWMASLVTAGADADGTRVPNVALFCANATPPHGDGPALLTHDEVTTLFHEFGHLLHHMLSSVEVRSLAGTNVAWDFVELPSQIHENWAWEREALDLFAHHVETGAAIPEPLLEKMRRARTYRGASMQMRQLGFATVDLMLHRHFDPRKDGDVLTWARRTMAPFAPTPLPEGFAMLASFTHLFSGAVGYAAGYYSYKWAEVLDADAFSRFLERGIFDRATGQAFKDAVLSRGDAEDPMALFVRFMGREPALEPLLVRTGIAHTGDR
jgi:oligopeptidase A